MLKFDKVIKCCRGVVILHDILLVVYEVTKLVQHFHAKVIEVKKALRSCDSTSFIEFPRVLEYILMNSMEIYFVQVKGQLISIELFAFFSFAPKMNENIFVFLP